MDNNNQSTNEKSKPKRTCNFINVRNKSDILKIKSILGVPSDTEFTNTTCIFYVSLANPNQWGVTLKCFPKTEPNHYVWKYSFNWRDDSLLPAIHCQNMVSTVSGDGAKEVEAIFNNYKK